MQIKRKFIVNLFFWLLGFLASSWAYAKEAPTLLPEFVGGVQANAVWQDENFFKTANQCNMRYTCGNLGRETGERQACEMRAKNCLIDYMNKQGASQQAIAFVRYSDVPGLIKEVKHYGNVDVVDAKMQWADASGGFFIINKQGFIIPASMEMNIKDNADFKALQKQYPRAELWNLPGSITWPAVQTAANGNTQVVFTVPVKNGCNACAKLANADIAFNFDTNGKYLGTELLKLSPIS